MKIKLMGRSGFAQQGKRDHRSGLLAEKAAAALKILSRRDPDSHRVLENHRQQGSGDNHSYRVDVSSEEGDGGRRKVFVTHGRSSSPPRASYAETTKKGLRVEDRPMRREIYNGKGKLVFVEDGSGWKTATRIASPQREEKPSHNIAAPKGFRFTADGEVEPSCYNCGAWGHWKNDCVKETKCYFCKGHGHLARHCKAKNVMAREDGSSGSSASNASLEAKELRRTERLSGNERPRGVERSKRSEDVCLPPPHPSPVITRAVVGYCPASEELEKKMHFNVVASVRFGNPNEEEVRWELARRWPTNSEWSWQVKQFSPTSFLIPCSSEARVQQVLSSDSLSGKDFLVVLSRWNLEVGEYNREGLESSWFLISNFPTPCWHKEGFQDLVSSFGWVEEIDQATRFLRNMVYARVRVGFRHGTILSSEIFTSYKGKCYRVLTEQERGPRPVVSSTPCAGMRNQHKEEDVQQPLDHFQNNLHHANLHRSSKGKEVAIHVSECEPPPHVVSAKSHGPSKHPKGGDLIGSEVCRDRWAGQTLQQHFGSRSVPGSEKEISGSEKEGELSPFHKNSNNEVESDADQLKRLLNQSMSEAFFKFLKEDISALSGEQLIAWERLLRTGSGPSGLSGQIEPIKILEVPVERSEPGTNISIEKAHDSFVGLNSINDANSDEESLSYMLNEAGINLGRNSEVGSKKCTSMEELADMELVKAEVGMAEPLEGKSGFDSPTDEDIIDALKEVDETSPLEAAAKAWGLDSASKKGKGTPTLPSSTRSATQRRVLIEEELEPRRSIRQKQKHGGKSLSKDEMIAAAARSKIPTSVCSGSISQSVSVISFLPDSFILALSKACGIDLGPNLETQLLNVSLLREWVDSTSS